MTNSVASDLGLHCLQKIYKLISSTLRVKDCSYLLKPESSVFCSTKTQCPYVEIHIMRVLFFISLTQVIILCKIIMWSMFCIKKMYEKHSKS